MTARMYAEKDGTMYLGVDLRNGEVDYFLVDKVLSIFNTKEPENLTPITEKFDIWKGLR